VKIAALRSGPEHAEERWNKFTDQLLSKCNNFERYYCAGNQSTYRTCRNL